MVISINNNSVISMYSYIIGGYSMNNNSNKERPANLRDRNYAVRTREHGIYWYEDKEHLIARLHHEVFLLEAMLRKDKREDALSQSHLIWDITTELKRIKNK